MITSLLLLSASLAAAAPIDMSKPPEVAAMRAVKLPPRAEWRLKNGMTVILVEDKRVPLVTAQNNAEPPDTSACPSSPRVWRSPAAKPPSRPRTPAWPTPWLSS